MTSLKRLTVAEPRVLANMEDGSIVIISMNADSSVRVEEPFTCSGDESGDLKCCRTCCVFESDDMEYCVSFTEFGADKYFTFANESSRHH